MNLERLRAILTTIEFVDGGGRDTSVDQIVRLVDLLGQNKPTLGGAGLANFDVAVRSSRKADPPFIQILMTRRAGR